MMVPEFAKTKEFNEFICDHKSPDCGWSWEGYGWALKKRAPEWLVKALEKHIRLDKECEKKGLCL